MDNWQQALNSISGGHVLDVATGGGGFIQVLVENLRDYTAITGIDTSERALESARQRFSHEAVHFLLMDAAHLDFPDAAFDTVCISHSLHHLAELPRVLAEMLRVLKPGGHFILSEMYRDGLTEEQQTHVMVHHWWGEIDRALGGNHNETFTRQQLVELVNGLALHECVCYDVADLDRDPHDPEVLKILEDRIDHYCQRAQELPEAETLLQRGAALRERLQTVGFQSATALLAFGVKPKV